MTSESESKSPPKPNRETTSWPFSWSGVKYAALEFLEPTKKFDIKQIGQRTGDVAIITGGARGIGVEAVKKLLQCDFHVILGIRSIEAGEKVVRGFRESGITSGRATFLSLDLKSLKSVREFAEAVLKETPKIHILICNAGIMMTDYELTGDGFEVQFQVNYLSHFLLTQLLLPRIIETARESNHAGRIVSVSSTAAWAGGIKDISDIETRATVYNRYEAYCDSKLYQVAASNYMDKLLQNQGSNVNTYSLHPGVIITDLASHMITLPSAAKMITRKPEDGADVMLCAAASPRFEKKGGLFLMNCNAITQTTDALDEDLQKRLWDKSCKILGINSCLG